MFLSDAQQAYSNETSNCISAVHRLSIFRFVSQHCLHCYAAMRKGRSRGCGMAETGKYQGNFNFQVAFFQVVFFLVVVISKGR